MSWIHILTFLPNSCDGWIAFQVETNSTGLDRSATVTVAGMTLTVTERGR